MEGLKGVRWTRGTEERMDDRGGRKAPTGFGLAQENDRRCLRESGGRASDVRQVKFPAGAYTVQALVLVRTNLNLRRTRMT
jgi:hypothetical protein